MFEGEPEIDFNGVLVVHGYFPTHPDQLVFTQKYVMEQEQWRLLGLHIQFRKSPPIEQDK